MTKTIVVTGATDGIGLLTAEKLLALGHKVIVHGRNSQKLAHVVAKLSKVSPSVNSICADLSSIAATKALAQQLLNTENRIDVLINNAGVFKTTETISKNQLDMRFAVNTIAPFILTKLLKPLFNQNARVLNLSSAAQASVDLTNLQPPAKALDAMVAYAQSKLAIAMWTRYLAEQDKHSEICYLSVNPGSLLASKMVKTGFGVQGNDLNIGADILVKLAIADNVAQHSGAYFDNDIGQFSHLAADGEDQDKIKQLMMILNNLM